MSPADEIAYRTGDIWICPRCGRKYRLIHRGRYKTVNGKNVQYKQLKHDFEEVRTTKEEREKHINMAKQGKDLVDYMKEGEK